MTSLPNNPRLTHIQQIFLHLLQLDLYTSSNNLRSFTYYYSSDNLNKSIWANPLFVGNLTQPHIPLNFYRWQNGIFPHQQWFFHPSFIHTRAPNHHTRANHQVSYHVIKEAYLAVSLALSAQSVFVVWNIQKSLSRGRHTTDTKHLEHRTLHCDDSQILYPLYAFTLSY